MHAVLELSCWLVIGTSCFAAPAESANERLWLNAEINRKRARLCFDTGSDRDWLFRNAAQRFGLKVSEFPTNATLASGRIGNGTTEEFLLTVEGTQSRASFGVLETPPYGISDFDGVIGWRDLKDYIVRIDAIALMVTLPGEMDERLAGWTRLSVATNSDMLYLEIPHTQGSNGMLAVDTGSPLGVCLSPQRWRAWKTTHPHGPATLESYFNPSDGILVREESWATNVSFGPLVLTDVPIMEGAPSDSAKGGAQYEGTLGLAALKRLDVIVDGRRGVAHLRTKKSPPRPYQHNRAGAVFVPSGANSEVPVARVVDGSPAWEAGVRNGDILLKVDGETVSMSLTGKARLEAAPGTKVQLTLKREGKTFNATVTLRQILPPDDHKSN